jgi:hypothetical protein
VKIPKISHGPKIFWRPRQSHISDMHLHEPKTNLHGYLKWLIFDRPPKTFSTAPKDFLDRSLLNMLKVSQTSRIKLNINYIPTALWWSAKNQLHSLPSGGQLNISYIFLPSGGQLNISCIPCPLVVWPGMKSRGPSNVLSNGFSNDRSATCMKHLCFPKIKEIRPNTTNTLPPPGSMIAQQNWQS